MEFLVKAEHFHGESRNPESSEYFFTVFPEIRVEKTRQNAENKQTFDLTGKIEIVRKTRQNAENKQIKVSF